MPSDTYNLIRQAILDEQQILGVYNGHRREMCPHAIGTKNGREKTILLQFGGTSSSGLPVIKNDLHRTTAPGHHCP